MARKNRGFGWGGRPEKPFAIGMRFVRLTVEGPAAPLPMRQRWRRSSRHTYWDVKCACGRRLIVTRCALVTGRSKSCGCLRDEKSGARSRARAERRTSEAAVVAASEAVSAQRAKIRGLEVALRSSLTDMSALLQYACHLMDQEEIQAVQADIKARRSLLPEGYSDV